MAEIQILEDKDLGQLWMLISRYLCRLINRE